jgi:Ca-activated chloride channel homolog
MKKSLFLLMTLWCLSIWADDQVPGGFIEAEHEGKKILFPLLKSHYQVDIQGDLAQITLEQEFQNPTSTPLNASYLFPLNKDAAVHAMRMRVADELVEAKIRRLEEAKEAFNQAKQQGKSASLLEQHRPNMFTQQLANLMPDLPIHITLQYVQHIERLDGHYELVLPLVVGPRYQPEQIKQKITKQVGQWQLEALPDYPSVAGLNLPKEIEQERVSIEITLDGGMPVAAVSSPTHGIEIKSVDKQHRSITLSNGRVIDNRDFELHYRLAGEQVQAGLLTHEDERGHFFSVLLEPPAIPQSEAITPREMVFVLDTSGSMSGDPLKASKAFMQQVLHHLRPSDHFRIIDFSNSPREFHATPLPATAENLRRGQAHVQGFQAGGGTEINRAIEQALSVPVIQNHLRIVVFLTDGYIGNEQSVLQHIQSLRGSARIYALGVGTGVNRYLLDEMAQAGQGFVRYIDPTEEIEGAAQRFAERLRTPILTDVSIDWGNTQVEQVTPARLPDLFSGDSLRILGKIKQVGNKSIKILGHINGQQATLPLKLQLNQKTAEQSQAIPLIWAKSRIVDYMREMTRPNDRRFSELTDELLQEKVTQLGLDFSLMTRWTAFIAVSQKIYNEQPSASKEASVPLPMVKGISQNAYPTQQFHGSSAPEAEEGLMLLILVLAGLFWWQRRQQEKTVATQNIGMS